MMIFVEYDVQRKSGSSSKLLNVLIITAKTSTSKQFIIWSYESLCACVRARDFTLTVFLEHNLLLNHNLLQLT